jgi:inhibitor of cysteine peptidase
MIRMSALLILLVVILGACSATTSLNLDDDRTHVTLKTGDEFTVTLEGNATTGFEWELVEFDPTVISAPTQPIYEPTNASLVGGGGVWTWTLMAQGPGECEVSFVYHRTWEDELPEATFSFSATVNQ